MAFWVVFLCSFQFRNAAVNVAEAGSDVRLRAAQMEEVCNSRVKEINFSMRALFPKKKNSFPRRIKTGRGQISELIVNEASIKVLHNAIDIYLVNLVSIYPASCELPMQWRVTKPTFIPRAMKKTPCDTYFVIKAFIGDELSYVKYSARIP